MLLLKSSFSKIYTIMIILLISPNFNNVWANNFISRGYYVIDLSHKVEWMTCTVGMVWDQNNCVGKPIKIKLDQINSVINQANDQLDGSWRLPNRKELESLVCKDCKKAKINSLIFPNTPPDSFWTSEKNPWQSQFMWTVNFFTGNTFGRFPSFIPNYVRLVRDR